LKIADFGFAIVVMGRDGTGMLHTRLGAESYIAPEIHLRKPYIGESVDLLAAGIILFIMLSQNPPFGKADPNEAYYRLLHTRDERFWTMHSRGKVPGFYSPEFRSLITNMLALNPNERLSIQALREHPWVNGPTASAEEVREEISRRKAKIVQAAEEAKARRNNATGVVHQGGRYYRGDASESDTMTLSFSVQNDEIPVKLLPAKGANPNKYLQILTGLAPKDIMTVLSNELKKKEAKCVPAINSFDMRVELVTETDCLKFKTTLFKTPEDLYVLDFILNEGNHFDMMRFVREITEKVQELQLS